VIWERRKRGQGCGDVGRVRRYELFERVLGHVPGASYGWQALASSQAATVVSSLYAEYGRDLLFFAICCLCMISVRTSVPVDNQSAVRENDAMRIVAIKV
jgi:hypothetical protein